MRIIGRLLLLLVLCFVVLHACYYPWTLVREGLEMVGNHYSSYGVDGDLFLTREFLDKYQYSDGFFRYEGFEPDLFKLVERALVWLTYEDDVYALAKSEMLNARNMENEMLDGTEAFGFVFYMNKNFSFPSCFTAIAFNDSAQTLLFIGFCIEEDNEDYNYCQLAESNMEGFLMHYFCEWYDW